MGWGWGGDGVGMGSVSIESAKDLKVRPSPVMHVQCIPSTFKSHSASSNSVRLCPLTEHYSSSSNSVQQSISTSGS